VTAIQPSRRGIKYTDAEVDQILTAVIRHDGQIETAVRELEADGIGVHANTIKRWLEYKHLDRYNDLRQKYADDVEADLIHQYRKVSRQAVDVQSLALEKAIERLETGKDKDPSRTAVNAATVADKMTTKMLSLSGRPTQIHETRNPLEIMRSLAALGVVKIDIPDAEVVEPDQLEEGTS
jgi:hypothetical protein